MFQAIWKFFEKVTERSRDSGRRLGDRRPTVKQRFSDVSSNLEFFWKSHRTVTRQWLEVTRLSADCRTTFFRCFKQFGFSWKKSLNGHATVVGGHATVGRLSNNVFWTFQAIRKIFVKSHWTVTRQWSEVTRPSADCQAHICMNKRERERISVTLHTGTAMLCRWLFHQPASPLKLALAGVKVLPAYTFRRSAGTASLWIL